MQIPNIYDDLFAACKKDSKPQLTYQIVKVPETFPSPRVTCNNDPEGYCLQQWEVSQKRMVYY